MRLNLKSACFSVYWVALLAVIAYIFYINSVMPILLNKHRLRYSQLDLFQIYTFPLADYFNFRVEQQTLHLLSFKQQIEYDYKYLLAAHVELPSTHPDLDRYTNSSLTNDSNATLSLYPLSWSQFGLFMNDTFDRFHSDDNKQYLYIIQYSQSKCHPDFEHCASDHMHSEPEDQLLFYTEINNVHFINLNSELVSNILDDPRDALNIFIGVEFAMLIVCIMLLVRSRELTKTAYIFLLSLIFALASYFCWLFTLTFIPVFFTVPYDMMLNNELDYFSMVSHSLVYSIGSDFKLVYWCYSVITHGIWVFTLAVSFPLLTCIYGLTLCLCCCKEDRAEPVCGYFTVPLMFVIMLGVFGMAGWFWFVFVVTMIDWNDLSVFLSNDSHFIEIIVGIGCLVVVIPVFGCIMALISSSSQQAYVSKVSQSFRRIPMVNRMSSHHHVIAKGDDEPSSTGSKDGYYNVPRYENETRGVSELNNDHRVEHDHEDYDL